jgi:hypothetical protein
MYLSELPLELEKIPVIVYCRLAVSVPVYNDIHIILRGL